MLPIAVIEHQLPGRTRLRIPKRPRDVDFSNAVERLSKRLDVKEINAPGMCVLYRNPTSQHGSSKHRLDTVRHNAERHEAGTSS